MGSSRHGGGRAPIRIAVVGVGTIAQAVHLPALRRLGPAFDLRVVCDASPGRARDVAAGFGAQVRWVTSAEEAVTADGVEAVLLATPGSHAALARIALEAGRHVLAEKPFSLTAAGAADAGALAARLGLVLQVGYMKMYDPVVEVAARELHTMERCRLVRVTVCHPADRHQLAHLLVQPYGDADPSVLEAAEAGEVASTRAALGAVPAALAHYYRAVLMGSVVHELALLRALGIGLPTSFEHVETWPPPGAPEPPCLLATAAVAPDVRLVLSWNWLPDHPEYGEEVAVLAAGSRLYLDVAPPYLLEARSRLRVLRAEGPLRSASTILHGHDSGFVRQLRAFADAVRSGTPARADAAGAAADARCLQGLLATLARRQGVAVGGEAAALAAAAAGGGPESRAPG